MKNAFIFLIIITSAATYVFLRPQGNGEAGAQLFNMIMCARPNLPQIVIDICTGKRNITQLFSPAIAPTGGSTGGSAGTTPSNTIATFNRGVFVTPPTTPATTNPVLMMNQYKGTFVDMNGNTIQMTFPTPYGGPTYPSQMCSNGRFAPCPRDGGACNVHTACGE